MASATMANDDWDGAASMHKALKVLATSSRPISASRVKTAAATALDNVKVCALSNRVFSNRGPLETHEQEARPSTWLPLEGSR